MESCITRKKTFVVPLLIVSFILILLAWPWRAWWR
jgi:hypothetical protein